MQLNSNLQALLPIFLNFTNAHDGHDDAHENDIVTRPNATAHKVDLGNGGPGFQPDQLFVQPGDKVNITIYPGTHGVAQSSFSKPCEPLSGGIYSGNVATGNGPSPCYVFRVNDSSTIWLYSTVGNECAEGAVLAINPRPDGQAETLAAYKAAAKNVTSKFPAVVNGGTMYLHKGDNSTNMTAPGHSHSMGRVNVTNSPTTTSHNGSATHFATTTQSNSGATKTAGAVKIVEGELEWMILLGLGVFGVGIL